MNDIVKQEQRSQEVSTGLSAESQAMISMIERVAMNPDADVDKLRVMIDMKMELFERGAEVEFNAAMSLVQEEIKPVIKMHNNNQTKSRYAKLEDILAECSPIWTRHGFALSFGTADATRENYQRVECIVSHRAGHSRKYHADLPIDDAGIAGTKNKTGVHGFGSTTSYARRYLTGMIFNIPTYDDNDGNTPAKKQADSKVIDDEQMTALKRAMLKAGVDNEYMCKLADIDSLDQLRAGRYQGAIKHLSRLQAKRMNEANSEGAQS